ncbi:hypothetical protein [Leptolyngbya sp. 7M]|uniref:hypothetical protein n=1 Tax=Leptolyngbya sp. 7M TaxID=2812896 RepID=UPI001B8D8D9A|nr:hypothetical protein [Leptolyngbya sp. 7M]QYO65930.1 hypothetical protein JVX88_03780 [Leptolyngbya sp. 7M]
MNDGTLDGMQTFDKVLERYIREGLITRETGMAYASNATNLALAISDLDDTSTRPMQQVDVVAPMATQNEVMIEGFER